MVYSVLIYNYMHNFHRIEFTDFSYHNFRNGHRDNTWSKFWTASDESIDLVGKAALASAE
jgi:hypothetical protein